MHEAARESSHSHSHPATYTAYEVQQHLRPTPQKVPRTPNPPPTDRPTLSITESERAAEVHTTPAGCTTPFPARTFPTPSTTPHRRGPDRELVALQCSCPHRCGSGPPVRPCPLPPLLLFARPPPALMGVWLSHNMACDACMPACLHAGRKGRDLRCDGDAWWRGTFCVPLLPSLPGLGACKRVRVVRVENERSLDVVCENGCRRGRAGLGKDSMHKVPSRRL